MKTNYSNLLMPLILLTIAFNGCSQQDIRETSLGEFLYSEDIRYRAKELLNEAEYEALMSGVTYFMLENSITPQDTVAVRNQTVTVAELIEINQIREQELKKISTNREAEIKKMTAIVRIDIKGKKIIEKNDAKFRTIDFDLTNLSGKTIQKIDIVFHVKEKASGNPIANLTYSVDMLFEPAKAMETTAFWEYSDSEQTHMEFGNLEFDEISIESFPTSVTFENGETVKFNAQIQMPII